MQPWPLDLLAGLNASWDGIALIDVNGRVAWKNRVLQAWTNGPQSPEPWVLLLSPAHRDGARVAFRRMLASGTERFEAGLSGSTRRRFLCTLTPLGERAYGGALLLVHDPGRATSGHEAEVARLKELNEARTRFINTAAHEFSTPLTSLRLQTHLLRSGSLGPLSTEQARAAEVLDRNMERLVNLVRNVLDVARLGADRLIVEKQAEDLSDIARHAVASQEAVAHDRHVALTLDVPTAVPVEADRDRMTQVFVNLVHNAIKFTPSGGRVDVRVVADEHRVRVEVRDTGMGISEQDIAQLFMPFSQGRRGIEEAGGSGLGLSICQGIVAQHDGRIWCESAGEGKGSTFSFDLPLRVAGRSSDTIGLALGARRSTEERGGWTLFYFRCPQCGSRDLEVRLLRNYYDCNACGYAWR